MIYEPIDISASDANQVQQKLAQVEQELLQYVIALTPTERQTLPKMADGRLPFVQKVLRYLKHDPQLGPNYVDRQVMERHLADYQKMVEIHTMLEKLLSNVTDTLTASGSEVFSNALAYYHSVKMAARLDRPNAKPLYNNLKKLFEVSSSKKADDAQKPDDSNSTDDESDQAPEDTGTA